MFYKFNSCIFQILFLIIMLYYLSNYFRTEMYLKVFYSIYINLFDHFINHNKIFFISRFTYSKFRFYNFEGRYNSMFLINFQLCVEFFNFLKNNYLFIC